MITTAAFTVLAEVAGDPWAWTRNPVAFKRQMTAPTHPKPPGPKGLPVVGSTVSFVRDPFEFFRRCAQDYGDVFRVPFPAIDIVVLNHPDYIGHILSSHSDNYGHDRFRQQLHKVFGQGLPWIDGDLWRSHRKLLNPMFGRRRLIDLSTLMVEELERQIDRWDRVADTGEVIDLELSLAAMSLGALLKSMFSTDVSDEEIDDVRAHMDQLFRMAGPLSFLLGAAPMWVPSPQRDRRRGAVKGVRTFVDRLIAQRRANPNIDGTDLLSMLLDARFDDGGGLSDEELWGEIFALLGGGFETIVAAMAWTVGLLAAHPEHVATLVEEATAIEGAPNADDLPSLKFAKACFDEAQRLQGHPLNPRTAVVDDEIGGYFIPKGTTVGYSMHATHRDPRWWPDPDRFDPYRFLDDQLVADRPKFAYLPFGAGSRHCIGSSMAYMEVQFALALIYQRYEIRTAPGWTAKHKFHISTGLQGGLPVTLHRRTRTSRAVA